MAESGIKSRRRQTAEANVDAHIRMDVDAIVATRTPDFVRIMLPAAMGLRPMNVDQYAAALRSLVPIFHNFELTVLDLIEDERANRICMYLKARADTMAGEYVNEYMWTLDFNEDGTKITRALEFTDSVMQRDFWPKLKQAMKDHAERKNGVNNHSQP